MKQPKRIAVIKTAWCDSYTGQYPEGNFSHLKGGGEGAERFNMLPSNGEFHVYTMPKSGKAPLPTPEEDWFIFHVSRDPAELKMKLVGWYENASFTGRYLYRGSDSLSQGEGYDGSDYCIIAERAFEIPAADRPIVEHDGRFKMSSIYWMQGNEGYRPKKPWDQVLNRLVRLHDEFRDLAYAPNADERPDIGDTRKPAVETDGIETDDGGDPYGHSSCAESPEHLALKEWAVASPQFFEYDADPEETESRPELALASGDRVDASHMNADYATLIEVKSRRSGEKDVERGIFQCVKYRAVFDAMQKGATNKRTTNTILLVENEVSDRLQTLADRLDVEIVQHRLEQ